MSLALRSDPDRSDIIVSFNRFLPFECPSPEPEEKGGGAAAGSEATNFTALFPFCTVKIKVRSQSHFQAQDIKDDAAILLVPAV